MQPRIRIAGFVLLSVALIVLAGSFCAGGGKESGDWYLSALPSSVRLDPSSGKIIEDRPDIYKMEPLGNLVEKNWIYDGGVVRVHAARGEYVSFQVVISRAGSGALKDIRVEMPRFSREGAALGADPELFLEWSVQVKTPSTGYEKSSLGPGWYPDALIPMECIQQDVERFNRLSYPLELPDFRNRVDSQRCQLIWVDQYVPPERESAPPGVYTSQVSVTIGGKTVSLPVELQVWDFALPNENRLAANLQHEGFLRGMNQRQELAIYQLFKKHRVVPADPTYTPRLEVSPSGEVRIDWTAFDQRLSKYLTGEAFTEAYGYRGPGLGEPLEQFVLPFDVYGKYGTRGWPDIGPPDEEKRPDRAAVYLEAIRQVREHMLGLADPGKTRLIVYLNGLDESYFPEAWERMDYYGKLFDKYFPECHYRVDGSYSREAMEVIHDAIDYWCCHTIGYNLDTIEDYRKLGVTDWLYGPLLYEREENGWCGSSTFMDLQLTNERAISWICWKYRTLTWCSWGIGSDWMTGWYNSETWKDYFRDHGQGPLSYRSYNGNALAVYAPGMVPGVNVPCPTIRLKNMRDGVEEYEYFRLLSDLDQSTQRADSLVNRIIYRPLGEQSIGNLQVWNGNPSEWDAVRDQAGGMIEKAQAGM